MKFSELESIFQSQIYLEKERDFLPVITATILANRLDIEPVWLMVIAPPSSGKTKLTSPFGKIDEVIMVSLLGKNSLISGARRKDTEDGSDASLLAKLDGKNILIPDASTITEMHPNDRSQIFSQLRAAFDGQLDKNTGLGRKEYNAKFGMIICGTPSVERSRTFEAGLGERFLYYRPAYDVENCDDIWEKIKFTSNRQTSSVLTDATREFFNSVIDIPVPVKNDDIYAMGKQIVRLRASVSRDYKTRKIDYPVGDYEAPFRATKQLSALYAALLSIVSPGRAMSVLKRLVKHTIPYPRLKVLTAMHRHRLTTEESLSAFFAMDTRTIERILGDLTVLKVITTRDDHYRINSEYKKLFNLRPSI